MTDTSTPEEDLTSGSNFDINDVIARAIAANAEEPVDTSLSDAADGPVSDEETGELPAEEAVDAEDPEITPEEAPVEGANSEPVQPEPAQETPPKAAENDARDERIKYLESLVVQSQQAIRDLAAQRQPEKPAAPMSKVSEEAVRLALFGGQEGAEAWKSLNPADRAEAERVAREYFKREAKAAVDPAARYAEIREQVLSEVSDLVGPLVQDFYDRQAAATFEKVAGSIKEPAEKKRLQELYSQHPGSRGTTLAEQKAALETAAQRLDIERQKKALEEREQKLTAKTRQEQANRNARLGGKTNVRRSDAPVKKAVWEEGDNVVTFFQKQMAMESAGT